MNERERNEEFVASVRLALDRSADRIDPATRARLRQARAAALKRASALSRRAAWSRPLEGLAAVASVAALAWALWTLGPASRPQPDMQALELLMAEDLELVADLDFYTWLVEQPDAR